MSLARVGGIARHVDDHGGARPAQDIHTTGSIPERADW